MRRGRDSNPRYGFNRTHAFQACDLNHSSTAPKPTIVAAGRGRSQALPDVFPACTMRIAEAMSAAVSFMLLGTIRVVVASAATLP